MYNPACALLFEGGGNVDNSDHAVFLKSIHSSPTSISKGS